MANMLVRLWKEYIFGISIILLIMGLVTLIFGILGMWFSDVLVTSFAMNQDVLPWSLYILIVGVLFALIGAYYLYEFITNKKFLLEEIETKKRSEFMKSHIELKKSVRKLPSKYQEMLEKKKKELKIK